MAIYTVVYNSYPNCPEATEYSKRRAVNGSKLNMIVGIGNLMAVLYFVGSTIEIFASEDWANFFLSILVLIIFAIFSFQLYVVRDRKTDRKCKLMVIRKKFNNVNEDIIADIERDLLTDEKEEIIDIFKISSLFFIGGVFDVIGITGFISGIYYSIHNGDNNITLIIISLLSVIIISTAVWYLYFKLKGELPSISEKLAVKRSNKYSNPITNSERMNDEFLFCRKCGSKLVPDSVFCKKCGTKIV